VIVDEHDSPDHPPRPIGWHDLLARPADPRDRKPLLHLQLLANHTVPAPVTIWAPEPTLR
jgi:hypothetical protein